MLNNRLSVPFPVPPNIPLPIPQTGHRHSHNHVSVFYFFNFVDSARTFGMWTHVAQGTMHYVWAQISPANGQFARASTGPLLSIVKNIRRESNLFAR